MEKGRGKGTDTLQTEKVFTRNEYIEREAAIAFMNEVEPCICHDPDGAVFTATKDSNMLEFLRAIPAADVVPVRHGKWETAFLAHEYLGCRPYAHYCSVCHQIIAFRTFYCPNCGARMDGDGE